MGDRIKVLQHTGAGGQGASQPDQQSLKVTRIEKRAGMGKVQLQVAVAGDVVSLAGAADAAGIADTIAAPGVEVALDPGPIDPPTLRWEKGWECEQAVRLAWPMVHAHACIMAAPAHYHHHGIRCGVRMLS